MVRRFIEHEQLHTATQREQQREFAAHAERESGRLLVQRQLERVQVALLEIAPPARIERRREADDLLDGHVVVERLVLVHEAGARPDGHARCGIACRQAEHACLSGSGSSHAEQQLDRGRLAGPVATEESEDGALRHAEVQPTQRIGRIEALP